MVLVFLAVGASRLAIDNSAANFLGQGSDSWVRYQRSLELFGGDEFVAVAFEVDEPFSRVGLDRVRRLQSELELLPGVSRVDSLASVPLIRLGSDEVLEIDGTIESGVPEDPAGLASLRKLVDSDLIAPKALISADERTFALNVILDDAVASDRTGVVRQIRGLAEEAWVSGVPVFRTQINADTLRETLLFVPITSTAIFLLLLAVFRSSRAALLPLAVGGTGTLASVGLLGWVGTPLSLSTMILPPILLALGSAYAMHVVVAAANSANVRELEESLASVAVPVALSGLTTSLGFLAMSTTSTRAIQELALYGAPGVLVLTVASLSALPAMLALLLKSGHKFAGVAVLSTFLPDLLTRVALHHRRSVFGFWAVFALVACLGISKLSVSSDLIRWYSPDSSIRLEYSAIRQRLSGISPVNIIVEATNGGVVTEPAALEAIDGLARSLEGRRDVGKALSLAEPMRLMRRALGAGDGLPESREEVEQYLLLLESAEQLGDVVTEDRSSANILLRVDDNQSSAISEVANSAQQWWAKKGLEGYSVHATGIMHEFATEQDGIVRTQLVGLSAALGSIGVVLWLVVGSIRLAAITLLPNLVPLAGAYGLMGLWGIPLDAATACLGSLALGIGVDDTVHVALGIGSRVGEGQSVADAIGGCMRSVMQPLVVSTAAIALGFCVLGFSELVLIRNLGLVTVVVVTLCWAADVTLLPALLARPDSLGAASDPLVSA